jgi:hypothetical protein
LIADKEYKSMTINEAEQILECFRNSRLQPLVNSLVNSAVRYSRLRVDWYLADMESRQAVDQERTMAQKAFISACDILSRNMGEAGENISWRIQIGSDRKSIGDFVGLLHAAIGIKAR